MPVMRDRGGEKFGPGKCDVLPVQDNKKPWQVV